MKLGFGYYTQNKLQKFSQFAYCNLILVWYNKDKLKQENEIEKGDLKMSYYVDKEKAMKLANLHIEALKTTLSFTDEIKEVLQKFNGKTITKRIDTALKKINSNLHMSREYNSFRINWFVENRSFGENGGTYYIKEHTISILWASCFSSYGDGVLDSENCLIAEQAIKELDRQNEQTKESIKNAIEQLANIETVISEHERIKKELEGFNRSINWLVNSYFELRID